MESKEIEIKEYGVRITVFENGDVHVYTHGDVYVLRARKIVSCGKTVIGLGVD